MRASWSRRPTSPSTSTSRTSTATPTCSKSSSAACARNWTRTANSSRRLEFAVRVQFLAQAADEDFEHVGVAVEVLLVDVLGEVGLRDQLARMHHQVFEDLVLVAGEVHVGPVD